MLAAFRHCAFKGGLCAISISLRTVAAPRSPLTRFLSTTGASSSAPLPPPPLSTKIYKDVKKWFFRYYKLKAGLLLGGAGLLYWWYVSEDNITRMMHAFEVGQCPVVPIPDTFKVQRPEVVRQIQAILQPTPDDLQFNYFLIVGETGTGKTIAIKEAVSGLQPPRGVVYFMAPENPGALAVHLAKAVDYDPNTIDLLGSLKRRLSGRTQEAPTSELKELLICLRDLATSYKAKHGRPPVLVIDGADLIAKRDPDLMKVLQDFAKEQADANGIRVVFASSEGSTLPIMMASSSIKRGKVCVDAHLVVLNLNRN